MAKDATDQVLGDHRKIGKRFIPPFMHLLGTLQETKWVDAPLPELFWLALLNDRWGPRRGAALGLEVARGAVELRGHAKDEKKVWFAPASAYSKLSGSQCQGLARLLESNGSLLELRLALRPLVALYPEWPLAFLFEGSNSASGEDTNHLPVLKRVLGELFDKTERPAMLAQGNAIYIAFVTNMLVVNRGTVLENFPAIADYPRTEESKRVGSGVRATINAFFGASYDNSSTWPSYFWNRGLVIDRCQIDRDSQL